MKMLKDWIDRYLLDPQLFILGILLLFGFLLIFTFGAMLAPVLAAVVIAYLLEGMVETLRKAKVPRGVAVILVFCVFMAGLMALFVVFLPMLSKQIGQLIQDLPKMIAVGQKSLMALPQRYPDVISESQISQILEAVHKGLTGLGKSVLSLSLASVKGLITMTVYLILVPLLVFFFLKDKTKILNWIMNLLPQERKLANEVWLEVNRQVANYVRGKIWEILIVFTVTYATFNFIDLQFAMLLAVFVGLSVIAPYIGATVMFFPVALIAYFQWGWTAPFAYAVIAYGIIQALDGNLLAPLLLSGVVNLHPVAIIVAVLVFGGLWGVWGLFFAIPLATLVHAVIKALVKRREQSMMSQPPDAQEATAV